MAEIRGSFQNLGELQRDLDSVEVGLGSLIGEVAKEQLGPVVAEVEAHLPFDATHRGWKGWDPSWKSKDPGHIKASAVGGVAGNSLTVRTTHPGGAAQWWGGTIAPKGAPITLTPAPGGGREFESKTAAKVARDVENALDRLCREHGL